MALPIKKRRGTEEGDGDTHDEDMDTGDATAQEVRPVLNCCSFHLEGLVLGLSR